MTTPRVSVVVVSRARPDALRRCLTGVSQLQYAPFEVVVVADKAGCGAVALLPFSDKIKTVVFEEANISAARNLGVSHAAGEIVAFLDDDAVPEPTWLQHLMGAAQDDVAAFGGYVRGRNGISFQWQSQRVDDGGWTTPAALPDDRPHVMHMQDGKAVKTEGTNMAFRRKILQELGGFDPAFRYFLDETDLNLRLGAAGFATAIVPLAEVHHGFDANLTRRSDRAPDDLFEIGASWAVFQRKHLPSEKWEGHWQDQREVQRRRVLEHMVAGRLEPRDVGLRLARLDAGYAEGKTRKISGGQIDAEPRSSFQPFDAPGRASVWMTTRPLLAQKDMQAAVARVQRGEIVTLLSLSRSSLFHHVQFTDDGIWLQKGGLFGRSDRRGPLFQAQSRRSREQSERKRVAAQRGL